MTKTDTPRMDEIDCAFCHSENYACGTTEEKMPKGDVRSPRLYQSDLCCEREARRKAEVELVALKEIK